MKLLTRVDIHAGAILVEALARDAAWHQILLALAFIELQRDPRDYRVNRVVEVSRTDGVRPYLLPDESV